MHCTVGHGVILLLTLSPEPRKLLGGIGIQLGTDEQDFPELQSETVKT